MKAVLVATAEAPAYEAIAGSFGEHMEVVRAEGPAACFSATAARRFEFVFVDIRFLASSPERKGTPAVRAGIQSLRRAFPSVEIVVLAPPDQIRQALQSLREGAGHYLTYPVLADELRYVRVSLEESRRVQSELEYLRQSAGAPETPDLLSPASPAMKRVLEKVEAAAPTKTTVLLTGETGTGKGVIARLIHARSNRRAGRFIAVHCGAIPDTLLESELFGHEKGAFTGAVRRRLGKFEIAHGGTLFLDEIGTVSPSMQIKLLQFLQDRTFVRVGGEEDIETDVRILAAANEDLARRCEEGSFRVDLFYRLNVFPIEIPPLRERQEDIPALAEGFVLRMNRSRTHPVESIHPDVMDAFQRYPWPGNIREMENLMERAGILETGSVLTPRSFPSDLMAHGTEGARTPAGGGSTTLAEVRRAAVLEVERAYLSQLLAAHRGKLVDAARAAGVSTRQLRSLMGRHGLRKEAFRKPSSRA